MYRALIVDDEMIFREYLRTLLDWEQYGIVIAGAAKNGETALALMKSQRFDIAFVDISMPVMNGIDFSAAALGINPELVIVLISGHNEFEYAKSALQMGIRDYILKPFDRIELTETVRKVVQELTQRRKRQIQENKREQVSAEIYANVLVSNEFFAMRKEIERLLEQISGGRDIGGYRVAVVKEDFFDRKWIASGQKSLWKSMVINIMEELLEGKCLRFAFCGRSGDVVAILAFEAGESAQQYGGEELGRMCRMVQGRIGFSVTCALSEPVNDWRDIPMAYDGAIHLLERRMQLGAGKVLTRADEERFSTIRQYPQIPADRLTASLRNGDEEEVFQMLEAVFEGLYEQKADLEITGVVCMELISVCLSCLTERGLEIPDILGEDFSPFSQMKQLVSIKMARDRILEIYRRTAMACSDTRYTRSNKIAGQAREIIDENYADKNLSVEGVARRLYLNAGYLRTVFKKEYGVTVSGYLLRIRMEKAREIILSGKFKLSAVSQMVGFADAAYFSKCFKKYYGISPSSFENMQKNPGIIRENCRTGEKGD